MTVQLLIKFIICNLLITICNAQIDSNGNSVKLYVDSVKTEKGFHYFGTNTQEGDTSSLAKIQNRANHTYDKEDSYLELQPSTQSPRYLGIYTIDSGFQKDDSISSKGMLDFTANIKMIGTEKNEAVWKILIRNFSTKKYEFLASSKNALVDEWSEWSRTKAVDNINDYFNDYGQAKLKVISTLSTTYTRMLIDYMGLVVRFYPFYYCSLRCSASCDDSEATWLTKMNRRCMGFYMLQGREWRDGLGWPMFGIRTKCECPSRDYTFSEACEPEKQANLYHCIMYELSSPNEINFGDLTNVHIFRVEVTGADQDIDFQGETKNSLFCELDAGEDIEFGGGPCPIQFHDNEVHSMVTGKDLQFEHGTWVGPDNTFLNVDIGDDFQFTEDAGFIRDTKVFENTWGNIDVDDKCNFNGIAEADVDVSGNTCAFFDVNDDSDCDPTVYDGFDCV